MSLKLFIVDDEAPARVRLKTLLSDIVLGSPHQLVGEADNAQDALDGIVATQPDLVLLDVQMPGMTGLELASHLKHAVAGMPAIVFVTAYDDYALQAFEVHALDYLLKPVRAVRLVQVIERVSVMRGQTEAMQRAIGATAVAMKSKRQHFSVQERGRVLLVPVPEALYLKAEAKYVTLRTRQRDYMIEEPLTVLEKELEHDFVRVHRNALVARNAITGVERTVMTPAADHDESDRYTWQVVLRDLDERLPISRRQWPVIKGLLKQGSLRETKR